VPRQTKNRRWNARVDIELPVAWQDERDGVVHVCTTTNLSASGLAIRSPKGLPIGAGVYLVVGHPSLGLSFEAVADVVRSWPTASSEFLIGLNFRSLPLELTAEIGRHVVSRLEQLERRRPSMP